MTETAFAEAVCHGHRPRRTLRGQLIDRPDLLEGQHDVADLAGPAVPHQFHLALVREQQKPVLVRQQLVGLNEPDDFLLLLFGESRRGKTLLGFLPGVRRWGMTENSTIEYPGVCGTTAVMVGKNRSLSPS